MVDVTLLQKNAYKDDRNISIEIRLPELPSAYEYIPDASIVMDTMQLKESLSESDSIEFVGCISSQFQVQLNSLPTQCGDLKGKKIYVNITSNETEAIPLFHGYIDDVISYEDSGQEFVVVVDKSEYQLGPLVPFTCHVLDPDPVHRSERSLRRREAG